MQNYTELLNNAPDHLSEEFLQYLRDNNPVIEEDTYFLIIENCKHHSPEKPYYTAFWKLGESYRDTDKLARLTFLDRHPEWEVTKRKKADQSVKRWHCHLIQ
jgi:hypothetical protein